MTTLIVVVEHDIDENELEQIADQIGGQLRDHEIIISEEPYSCVRLPYRCNSDGIIHRTRSHDDYDFSYNDRHKLEEIRSLPTYRSIELVNIEDESKILHILREHGIFNYYDWYSDNPFDIDDGIFTHVENNSVEDDLLHELSYHHGDGELYQTGLVHSFEANKAKREFIEWLDTVMPQSWYYDQNWNYVSYLAATESTLRLCENPKTRTLFPAEMKDKIENNRAYIVAAMVCSKTGVKDNEGREYVCIEDIITRIRGIKLSRLLFHKYLRCESERTEELGWRPMISLVPGDIAETGVSFWYHMLDETSLCYVSSDEKKDVFYERFMHLSKYEALDRDWQELYKSMNGSYNANIAFPRFKEYMSDDDSQYYYRLNGEREIIIHEVPKGDGLENENEKIEWQGPIEITELPKVQFKYKYEHEPYSLSFDYYTDGISVFRGDEEAVHRIWSVFECIRRDGKYEEKRMIEIENESSDNE